MNYLFTFSSIGISGNISFIKLPTPSNVAVTGRVYHKMHDINAGQHSLRWFLYNQQERANHAAGHSVPDYMRLFRDAIDSYVGQLYRAFSLFPPVYSKLENSTTDGEVAAIIHIANLLSIKPLSVYIHRKATDTSKEASILNSHYEIL